MDEAACKQAGAGVRLAARHALGWLGFGNAVGLWLAVGLVWPALQLGEWTYGRWVPVHLNVQLYGWSALPLVAWLLHIYEVDRSKAAAWAPAAVWAWTAALALGVLHWLDGRTSGKVFIDWQGGSLWGLVAAMGILWLVLAAGWCERAAGWNPARRALAAIGLLGLAAVPAAMVGVASPAAYPPVDATTGGPTGASLLGSTLVVVTLMMLLPWAGVMPWDWAGFTWPAETRVWRMAVFGWWGLLVLSGVAMYLPWVLDRVKFTQALVGHSHLAMAGFTTSFCALVLVALTGRPLGAWRSVAAWHGAVLVMIAVLAAMGWREGGDLSWMAVTPIWRTAGLHLRATCGAVMLTASLIWIKDWRMI